MPASTWKRSVLKVLCAVLALAGAARASAEPRHLRLFNTHTGKHLDLIYRIGETPVAGALADLQHFLCDHRNDQERAFDPALFDILTDLAHRVGRDHCEFHVISGYRSPASNETLRATRTGVAKKSLHMAARAMDIRLPGTPTALLRDTALAMARGGVGYYRSLDFIHVDTGPVRRW